MTTLLDSLETFAKNNPSKKMMEVFPLGLSVDYKTFWDWTADLAAQIPAPKKDSDFLAFRIHEAWQLPLALVATWRRGIGLFPLGVHTQEEKLLLQQIGTPLSLWDGLPERKGSTYQGAHPDPSGMALFLSTSGSTAFPKVFGFTHQTLMAAATLELSQPENSQGRILNLRPPFTSGGTNTLWPAFCAGNTLLFPSHPMQIPHEEALRSLVSNLKPDTIVASPAYLRTFLLSCKSTLPLPPTTLYFGGSRLQPKELISLLNLGFLPKMRYGMTECAHILSILHISPAEALSAPGNVGKPFLGVEVKVESNLCFRAPGFSNLQFKNGEPQKTLDDDLWYETDDRGFIGIGGELILEGRDHRQFVVAGFRVSAAELEQTLMKAKGVRDVAVVAMPNELNGSIAAALVVCEDSVDWEKNLRDHAEKHLVPHKRPRLYRKVDLIPSSASGKRLWHSIGELFKQKTENIWQKHFHLMERLRKQGAWKSIPHLNSLVNMYKNCLLSKMEHQDIVEAKKLLSLEGIRGKYTGYQTIWCWNALAYQYHKTHQSEELARNALVQALQLVPKLIGKRNFGKWTSCCHSVWLILILNDIRLDFRYGKFERGEKKAHQMQSFLMGESTDFGEFGLEIASLIRSGEYFFSREAELVEFLLNKLKAEESRWLS